MSEVINACVLLIGCRVADVRLISNSLIDDVQTRLIVEDVTKLSEGLERIAKGGVRAVIVDIEMPNARGITAIETLLTTVPHIPILVLSAVDNESVARQGVERGAYDYLLKSNLNSYRLRRTVRGMLDHHAADEQAFLYQQCATLSLLCTGDAVVISDGAGLVTQLNPPAELITGWSKKEAQGEPLGKIFSILDCETRKPDAEESPTSLETNGNSPYIHRALLVRRDGVTLNIKRCSAYLRNRDGNLAGSVAVFHDQGAARLKTLELSHQAQHDFLTDLPNRSLLNDLINQAISFARRYHKQLAVMFVDLDHFKRINDSLGHAVGDGLLQQVANRIVACVRRSDTVGRHGGDEFVVLLSQVGHAEDAVFIARKILSSLATGYLIDQKHLQINASIGVSTYPDDGHDADMLIHRADTAMYEAKKLGRNNCQFFRAEMQARVAEWQSLEGSLRCALERNEFILMYQPKIDLRTGEVTGVEALLRWKHPERALKAIGVQLAIDDFGVGYSSFSYLRKFPFDALKVDRSFINEICSNTDNAMILSALINIGKSLRHRVVAEGVETEEQLHFLQKEGCSEGQGFYFSRPVIAEKFAEFLERGVTESMVH